MKLGQLTLGIGGGVLSFLQILALTGCGAQSSEDSTTTAAFVRAGDVSPAFLRKLADPGGYRVDRSPSATESICGTDEMQQVNAYDGSLGQGVEYVRQHKFAVGAMADGTTAESTKYCTGTLVGPDLFITAGHCIDSSQTTNDYIAFNYEEAASGAPMTQDHFKIKEIVEEGGNIDYAVLRLEGKPGLKYGWAMVRTNAPTNDELITIVQHPSGEAKQVEVGHVKDSDSDGDYMRYGDLDTEPGSSGSGILDARGFLIGIHTNGGCSSSGGANSGVQLSTARTSTALSALAAVSVPLRNGSQINLSLATGTGALAALASGAVGLAVDATRQGATWTASDMSDGSFRLSQRVGGRTVYLDGKVGENGVGLSQSTGLGTRWRITKTDEGNYALRTVALGDGSAWLTARSEAREVGLGSTAGGWRLRVR